MPKFNIKFDGLEKMLGDLGRRAGATERGVASGLFMEAEETITAAKRLTPVDEGNLRASGHVQLPEISPGKVSVEMGFGGPAGSGNRGESNPEEVGYAVRVHEDLTARHPVGQAKYLEAPLNERRSGMPRRIARRASRG